jgi:DNA-binding MarR family transcriptional regulator
MLARRQRLLRVTEAGAELEASLFEALRERLAVGTYSAEAAFSEELKDMEREAAAADAEAAAKKGHWH